MSSSSPPDPPKPTLPLHAVPTDPSVGPVRRLPGRPKRARLAPVFDETVYNQQIAEQRRQHLDDDPVVVALRERGDAARVVHESLLALAQESAALLYERQKGERLGKDIALVASRRIDCLSKMATIILSMQRFGATDLIASPATTRKLVAVWLVDVGTLVRELIPADQAELLMRKYEARLRGDPELGGGGDASG